MGLKDAVSMGVDALAVLRDGARIARDCAAGQEIVALRFVALSRIMRQVPSRYWDGRDDDIAALVSRITDEVMVVGKASEPWPLEFMLRWASEWGRDVLLPTSLMLARSMNNDDGIGLVRLAAAATDDIEEELRWLARKNSIGG